MAPVPGRRPLPRMAGAACAYPYKKDPLNESAHRSYPSFALPLPGYAWPGEQKAFGFYHNQ